MSDIKDAGSRDKSSSVKSDVMTLVAEQIDWDTSERQRLKSFNRGMKFVAIVGWSIVFVLIVVNVVLVMRPKYLPVVVSVDKLSGSFEVSMGRQTISPSDKSKEPLIMSDLARYVKSREGFTRGEAEVNYMTVYLMSAPDLRPEWDNTFRPENNPNSLINTMKASDALIVKNFSITLLPTDKENTRLAQVRFDRERHVDGRRTIQRYISTITFMYSDENIPANMDGLVVNPFGFTALNYRRDKENEERELSGGGQ